MIWARVVKLADTLDLGSSAARREGSNPFPGTMLRWSFAKAKHSNLPYGLAFDYDCGTRAEAQ